METPKCVIDKVKSRIIRAAEGYSSSAATLANDIFDHPETGLVEHHAAELLTRELEEHGFSVERGICGLPTAFRAVRQNGSGGPSIGLLCEYDALAGFGHGCGHHMQGPSIISAAFALKDTLRQAPYKLVIYGTPAEESVGGKILMQQRGAFNDIDVALMMHASPTSTVDVKSMALLSYIVTFYGISSHAAINPEKGRSALDALLLACNGIEFMREHIKEDARLHYTILNAGGPSNKIPSEAAGEFTIRSYETDYVLSLAERVKSIFNGAAMMAGVGFEVTEQPFFKAKIPVLSLNDLLMHNAALVEAPCLRPPREKTGSTDFGNVMYALPGSCFRSAFVPDGTAAHSQEYLDAGKSAAAHKAILTAAKVLAMTACDLILDENKLKEIKREFEENKKSANF